MAPCWPGYPVEGWRLSDVASGPDRSGPDRYSFQTPNSSRAASEAAAEAFYCRKARLA